MKKWCRILLLFVSVVGVFFSCKKPDTLTENLHSPFGMCLYEGGVLISNLGGSDYLTKTPKGFITYYKNGKNKVVVKPNGVLFSPKGMAVKDNFLFVSDLGKIVVFDLAKDYKVIDQIPMPQENAFVSDVMAMGGTLFISVTNYNKIYLLNIEHPDKIDHSSLLEYVDIPYPSTIRSVGEYVFIASNSFDGSPYEDKIIHVIDNLSSPSLRPILHEEGDYQAMIVSPNGTRMIFSNFDRKGYIGNVVFENGEYVYESVGNKNSVFTSFLLYEGKLLMADIANSQVVAKEILEIDGLPTILVTK